VDAWVADLGLHLFGRVDRDALTARELPFVKFGLDAGYRPDCASRSHLIRPSRGYSSSP
jgi:hypothetical protein